MTLARFTGTLATTATDDTVKHAARTMRNRRVGCLIVTEADHPIGIVTDRDLVLRVLAEGIDPTTARIGDFVTYDPITVSVNDGFETAAERMRLHGIRRLPVVNEAGQAVGIVTADDLLALLGGELGAVCEGIKMPSDSTDSR
jgi:CBS domain-containing protein